MSARITKVKDKLYTNYCLGIDETTYKVLKNLNRKQTREFNNELRQFILKNALEKLLKEGENV